MSGSPTSRKDEWVRYALTALMTALISYFTAQRTTDLRISETDKKVQIVTTSEQNHFDEVQRTLFRVDENNRQRFELLQRAIDRIEATGQDRRTGEPYSVQRHYEK